MPETKARPLMPLAQVRATYGNASHQYVRALEAEVERLTVERDNAHAADDLRALLDVFDMAVRSEALLLDGTYDAAARLRAALDALDRKDTP